MPDLDPNLRSADAGDMLVIPNSSYLEMKSIIFTWKKLVISIARRVQDPLAELVKIEPKHIGIGMYQNIIWILPGIF
ncbi:S1 RNA-binding domain-containing protein 1-like [Python bivittatus]|uniref:S1 RNA-binding domain-containing protein 1-like n=1 Tax=Python bivittatus TaxID=176946 RepID=A0A9F5J7A8_PYTBI|nr:S1 RNA-binding domain-containing protein 1-like [Python bivittatus]